MYIRIIENDVLEEKKEAYLFAMREFVKDLSSTEGCISIDLSVEKRKVVTIERWESEEFVEKYSSEILGKYKKELKKGFISNSEKVYLV